MIHHLQLDFMAILLLGKKSWSGLQQAWRKLRGRGPCAPPPPDFGRSEGSAKQWWRAAFLRAHQDFKSLRHP